MDFTITTYSLLLQTFRKQGYVFQTFEKFLESPRERSVIIRHDVDERPHNALEMAITESNLGINATYFFRIYRISNDPAVISSIVKMGHEIGYHYEDYARANGDLDVAKTNFSTNLGYFRTYYPVKTVCMHGSSMSSHDNRAMWDYVQLSDFQLIGEPYISVDYSKVLYLCDTGRRWDGLHLSVRDHVENRFPYTFTSTQDIIDTLKRNDLPNQILLLTHTLWTSNLREWMWLESRERVRNILKILIVRNAALRKIAYRIIHRYSS